MKIKVSHAENVEKGIVIGRRLAMALRLACMVTFVEFLPEETAIDFDAEIESQKSHFISLQCPRNAAFAVHLIMFLTEAILTISVAGKGYRVMLSAVKRYLPFSLLNVFPQSFSMKRFRFLSISDLRNTFLYTI